MNSWTYYQLNWWLLIKQSALFSWNKRWRTMKLNRINYINFLGGWVWSEGLFGYFIKNIIFKYFQMRYLQNVLIKFVWNNKKRFKECCVYPAKMDKKQNIANNVGCKSLCLLFAKEYSIYKASGSEYFNNYISIMSEKDKRTIFTTFLMQITLKKLSENRN